MMVLRLQQGKSRKRKPEAHERRFRVPDSFKHATAGACSFLGRLITQMPACTSRPVAPVAVTVTSASPSASASAAPSSPAEDRGLLPVAEPLDSLDPRR